MPLLPLWAFMARSREKFTFTSYLVGSGFSWVTYLLSKVRNRLDVVKRGDLRVSLTTLQLDIQKLASVHQAQRTLRIQCQLTEYFYLYK
jgi:hypothetical protein